MSKFWLAAADVDTDYLFDDQSMTYEAANTSDDMSAGNIMEIYLPALKKNEFVAMYANGDSYFLVIGMDAMDLSQDGLTATIIDRLRHRQFTLYFDKKVVKTFRYVYGNRENDLLEDTVELLADPLCPIILKQSISFFTAKSKAQRLVIDNQNVVELLDARKEYRKQQPWNKQIMLFLKYGH
ncbi:MAG: hypothetical protein HRT35_23060 [Algicola sp.]|nr:hypothetical protein [Algicola sp.]